MGWFKWVCFFSGVIQIYCFIAKYSVGWLFRFLKFFNGVMENQTFFSRVSDFSVGQKIWPFSRHFFNGLASGADPNGSRRQGCLSKKKKAIYGKHLFRVFKFCEKANSQREIQPNQIEFFQNISFWIYFQGMVPARKLFSWINAKK